jgi:hypothetical protein
MPEEYLKYVRICPCCKIPLCVARDVEVGSVGWCPICEQNLSWNGVEYQALRSKVYDWLGNASADTY